MRGLHSTQLLCGFLVFSAEWHCSCTRGQDCISALRFLAATSPCVSVCLLYHGSKPNGVWCPFEALLSPSFSLTISALGVQSGECELFYTISPLICLEPMGNCNVLKILTLKQKLNWGNFLRKSHRKHLQAAILGKGCLRRELITSPILLLKRKKKMKEVRPFILSDYVEAGTKTVMSPSFHTESLGSGSEKNNRKHGRLYLILQWPIQDFRGDSSGWQNEGFSLKTD